MLHQRCDRTSKSLLLSYNLVFNYNFEEIVLFMVSPTISYVEKYINLVQGAVGAFLAGEPNIKTESNVESRQSMRNCYLELPHAIARASQT